MEKFNIGDKVYNAVCQWEQKEEVCPICFGKLVVTLILGNGDSVILPCDYCAKGYDGPTGSVKEYDFKVDAELVTITDIKVEISALDEKYKYFSCNRQYEPNNLFLEKEDALERAKELKVALDLEQSTRIEYIKKDKNKSFSWNAGYHIREAKRNREQAEYHDKKAIVCKERQRDEPIKG